MRPRDRHGTRPRPLAVRGDSRRRHKHRWVERIRFYKLRFEPEAGPEIRPAALPQTNRQQAATRHMLAHQHASNC